VVKLGPLLLEFAAREMRHSFIFTGQHSTLAAQTGVLSSSCTFLQVESHNEPISYVSRCLEALIRHANPTKPDLIVVQGDTASALAGARLGAGLQVPVAHVEAGLRSFDEADPWPEEMFRVEIDAISAIKFAPTVTALGNLLAENLQHGSFVVGNTVVDALQTRGIGPTRPEHRLRRVLVTLHRRESFGEPMKEMFRGLAESARRFGTYEFLWPIHPNPEVRKALAHVAMPENVKIVEPMAYEEFARCLSTSAATLTDSGGVIEEAVTLCVPAAIARDKTERPEAVQSGRAILAGRSAKGVLTAVTDALSMRVPRGDSGLPHYSTIFGDGLASQRIANHFVRGRYAS